MSRAIESDLAIGLSSGTSMDGIDAALVRLDQSAGPAAIELLGFETYAYTRSLAEALRSAGGSALPAELALLDVMVGEAFAGAALRLLEAAGLTSSAVTIARGIATPVSESVTMPAIAPRSPRRCSDRHHPTSRVRSDGTANSTRTTPFPEKATCCEGALTPNA